MNNPKQTCVLLMACAAALISTGCRSMAGRNMFSMRGEPSAEALAGSGPTTTYPAPPSESATPEAIASIAGGTASPSPVAKPSTSQVAGFDVTPGYATPAANMAAAQANGIDSGTKSASFESPAGSQTKPSGYTFGSKTFTPKPTDMPPPPPPSTYAISGTPPYAAPVPATASLTTPSTSFTPPPASSYTTPPVASSSPPASSGGYTLPTDSPAVAAITLPPTSTVTTPQSEVAASAAPAPSFSTASTASSVTAPSVTMPSASSDSGAYTPGSTSAAPYPTGDVTPTTTGSFYR